MRVDELSLHIHQSHNVVRPLWSDAKSVTEAGNAGEKQQQVQMVLGGDDAGMHVLLSLDNALEKRRHDPNNRSNNEIMTTCWSMCCLTC